MIPLETLASNETDPIYLPNIPWNCDYKVETIDFKLEVINTTQTYPFQNPMLKNETFVMPSGLYNNSHANQNYWSMDYNKTFTNAKLVPKNFSKHWLMVGATSQDYLNVSISDLEELTVFSTVCGNATYIPNGGPLPEDQEGRIFIFDEVEVECEDQLFNITNATGVILLRNTSTRYETSFDFSTLTTQAARINNTETNLPTVLEMLENNTIMLVDNSIDNETLTFVHNFSFLDTWWPEDDFFIIDSYKPAHINDRAKTIWSLNPRMKNLFQLGWCHGFIFYYRHLDDIHTMESTKRLWRGGAYNKWNQRIHYYGIYTPAIQFFSVNKSVGEWLVNNASTTTVSGYFEQEDNNVDAYNVVGNLTIEQSPDDKIVILSSRFDGWWGETPGDSAAGTAIILGIAKYFDDYEIKPKYNLSFLFTTGEEYLMRGSWHYSLTHPNNEHTSPDKKVNIIRWIGTDQLGFTQPEEPDPEFVYLACCKNETDRSIVENITSLSDFESKTGLNFKTEAVNLQAPISNLDDVAWIPRKNCKTIGICKDDPNIAWRRHHTAGMNYEEGDSLKNMNRSEVNETFELVWDIVKYYTVNPDCWLNSSNMNIVDSDDGDSYVDTVRHDPSVISTLPHDYAMVNLSLIGGFETPTVVVKSECINFTVNRSSTLKTINVTLPAGESPGYYYSKFELFNSTGWIDDTVTPANPGASANPNANVTDFSGLFFLYPYNYYLLPPNITNITDSPDPVGFGYNVTINADVTSDYGTIDTVNVYVTFPDNSFQNFTMSNTGGDTYEYIFNDTWQNGEYRYGIWAKDSNGNESGSSIETFNVSAQADISVCTIKDSYGDGELVNITDPPVDQIGYEFLDDGEVLHVWNRFDSYYFDTGNGIQFTNHYNDYWSTNVLILGYYNNDVWNLIYRTDELSGFNKDIECDGMSFVNATLWKNLSYEGYDFRLAIRYYLGVDDNELTVIPYIKNIDDEDIPFNIGFAWELKDIQVDMTPEGDYIEIDDISYYLNGDIDETYTDLDQPYYYIIEDKTGNRFESLYLRWDGSLDYKLMVKSRTGQYNAPVTLGIKIGTLSVGQEKYTSLFWHDASEATFYFDDYMIMGEEWMTNPGYMVDGNTSNYASTTINNDVELCLNNTCNGSDLGTISKVEIRCYGYYSGMNQRDIILRPVFYGKDGDNHNYVTTTSANWSQWFEITSDTNAPSPWDWFNVRDLDCDVEAGSSPPGTTVYCSKVEIRVTYNVNYGPSISYPSPLSGASGISIAPLLSITVNDLEGDTMNISWLSNSSGSWQVFGTNSSVTNGTYQQVFSNASVNGQWWYWKVNVSDGTNYNESSAFSFYTGYESKVVNTGSTNFKGYLLMQVQFYNSTSSSWVVADDTVNESTSRIMYWEDPGGSPGQHIFALDSVFNGLVNTSNLSGFGNGTYRVYAMFRDPDGDALVCDDDTELVATYEFTVTFD
jgi:hypothetical protein